MLPASLWTLHAEGHRHVRDRIKGARHPGLCVQNAYGAVWPALNGEPDRLPPPASGGCARY